MVPPADGRDFGGRVSPWHAPPGTGARPLATTGPPRRGMRVHRAAGADTAGPPPSLLSDPLPLRPAPPLLRASPTRTTPPTLFEGSFMLWTLLRRHLRPYRGHVLAVVVLQLVAILATLYLPSLNADIIDNGVAKIGRAHV